MCADILAEVVGATALVGQSGAAWGVVVFMFATMPCQPGAIQPGTRPQLGTGSAVLDPLLLGEPLPCLLVPGVLIVSAQRGEHRLFRR